MYENSVPLPDETRAEGVIYDYAYVRGRVAVVDIFPGQLLKEEHFSP